jgi:L-methionine (R)-S-oxide reductase
MTIRLDTVSELRRIVASTELREHRAELAAEAIRLSRGYRWVGIYDVEDEEIAAVAWTGTGSPSHIRFGKSEGLNGEALRTGEVVNVGDVTIDARYLTAFGTTCSEIIVPCRGEYDTVEGTIDVESDKMYAFGPEDVEFLKACAEALRPLWG